MPVSARPSSCECYSRRWCDAARPKVGSAGFASTTRTPFPNAFPAQLAALYSALLWRQVYAIVLPQGSELRKPIDLTLLDSTSFAATGSMKRCSRIVALRARTVPRSFLRRDGFLRSNATNRPAYDQVRHDRENERDGDRLPRIHESHAQTHMRRRPRRRTRRGCVRREPQLARSAAHDHREKERGSTGFKNLGIHVPKSKQSG
jgi:hypothetical protein